MKTLELKIKTAASDPNDNSEDTTTENISKTQEETPKPKLNTEDIKIDHKINYFIRIQLFLSAYLNLIDESITECKESSPEQKQIILQGRVIIAKSKMYKEIVKTLRGIKDIFVGIGKVGVGISKVGVGIGRFGKNFVTDQNARKDAFNAATTNINNAYNSTKKSVYNRFFTQKAGRRKKNVKRKSMKKGGLSLPNINISKKIESAKNQLGRIATATKQFFSKADADTKNKYAFLLYYNTFFSMYEDNAFSDILVEAGGEDSWRYKLFSSVMMVYNTLEKNKYLGSFLLIVTVITQVVFYAQFAFPALIVPAAAMTIAHKVICIGCLPFVEPAKIVIYKETEIKKHNEAIKEGTLIDENEDIKKQQEYQNLILPLFRNMYYVSLDYSKKGEIIPGLSPVQQTPVEQTPVNKDSKFPSPLAYNYNDR